LFLQNFGLVFHFTSFIFIEAASWSAGLQINLIDLGFWVGFEESRRVKFDLSFLFFFPWRKTKNKTQTNNLEFLDLLHVNLWRLF